MIVPWNACWTDEERYEIRPCRWASGKLALWQPHLPGSGKPVFARPHNVRQRRSVAEYRCTVCGEKTQGGDRWWFGLGETHIPGWAFATTEAPVHHACAQMAMDICPHLKRLGVGAAWFPHPDAVISQIVGGPATDRNFGLNLQGKKVIGHLKFAWRDMPHLPGVAND